MLILRIFLRSWRGGQLQLILGSLVLAVAVVTSVTILADRVEKALVNESHTFLAADLVLESNSLIPSSMPEKARSMGLQTSSIMTFISMVYSGEEMHLSSVRAVDRYYPLRGELTYSTTPFDSDNSEIEAAISGPPVGETWVDARLLPLLKIKLGDSIDFGNSKLKVSRILAQEPDSRGSFSFYGARILIHIDDVAPAGVLLPGSRVKHKLLLASQMNGDGKALSNYRGWIEPQLSVHQRLVDPHKAEASIGNAIERGRRFLLLSGSIGVVLSAIALALASHKFARDEVLRVGLFKSWGLSRNRIRLIYLGYSVLIGLVGSICGILLGTIVQEILVQLIRDWLPMSLPRAGLEPWLIGFSTGLLCVLGFMLPAIWHLPKLSPMTVLRKDLPADAVRGIYRWLIGIIAIALLLFWYSSSLLLSMAILLCLFVLAVSAASLGLIMFRFGNQLAKYLGGIWRLALANLWRRRTQNLVQISGFAAAISLLMIMTEVRTSLMDDWMLQLGDDMPNHFLINVAPYELDRVEELIGSRALETEGWYSLVRGRLRQFNGEDITEQKRDSHETLRRELNLSWTNDLPEGNDLVSGNWWTSGTARGLEDTIPVSIEDNLARELGLVLGDRLTFSIGGLNFEAVIASTRSLNWGKMTPNFYFLFPEGVLEDFPRTYMTSLHIPKDKKLLINDLLKNYPTIQVIELDRIIERIQNIIIQITRGLEVMTLLILGCGILVLFSAVSLSMSERLHESAILRTIGSSRRFILGSQCIEFASLGIVAGLLASLGAETALVAIQKFLFEKSVESFELTIHQWIWIIGPLSGGLLVGALGVIYSRQVVLRPPLDSLRRL